MEWCGYLTSFKKTQANKQTPTTDKKTPTNKKPQPDKKPQNLNQSHLLSSCL